MIPETMVQSQDGERFLKGFETLRLVGYMPTAHDRPTIGWGHTGMMPDGITPVQVGAVITEVEAEALYQHDTGWACAEMNKVNVERCAAGNPPLLQVQFDAGVSLVFNIGASNFQDSHVRKYIVAADNDNARPWWLAWDKQAGIELGGLDTRRLEEWQMYSNTGTVS